MALEILTLMLGPMENNTYLIADTETRQAAAIDPSFESQEVLARLEEHGWTLTAIWLTHAHFDHIAGVKLLSESTSPALPVGLHRADLPLWKQGGGARTFGLEIDPGPQPSLSFEEGQTLRLGSQSLAVRHAPGHTPGHVIFYSAAAGVAFCGDVIFYHGIGRTDLPGGNHAMLLESIRQKVFTLPPNTRLLSGHGPETSVAEEMAENPFL